MSIFNSNFILQADSYKLMHYAQMPEGVKWAQSSIVPRKTTANTKELVVAGTTYLAEYLARVRITRADVVEAMAEAQAQGYEINYGGWMRIVNECAGKLPLRVSALAEGTVVQANVAMVLIENTVEWAAWLPSYVETVAQCIIWKFSTVASICRGMYKDIMDARTRTGSDAAMTEYALHNFGDRGADSHEASAWAGMAHAMIFRGSDSTKTNLNIKMLYGGSSNFTSSVDATEHSTMCMNSVASERNDYGAAKMVVDRLFAAIDRAERGIGIPLMSVVIDTYDSHRFVRDYLGGGELKERIEQAGALGGKLVLRPDSGDPMVEPIEILELAGEVFGYTVNAAGFKVLPPYIGVLQGDGINQDSIRELMRRVEDAGWAVGNLVFGMGGGLVHEAGRDEFSFSQKLTAISFGSDKATWVPLKKDPITDRKKASLTGYLGYVLDQNGNIKSVDSNSAEYLNGNVVEPITIMCDGERSYFPSFADICERARN